MLPPRENWLDIDLCDRDEEGGYYISLASIVRHMRRDGVGESCIVIRLSADQRRRQRTPAEWVEFVRSVPSEPQLVSISAAVPMPPGPGTARLDDRHVCTAANPWDHNPARLAEHPDAINLGMCDFGCCRKMRCPHCQRAWQSSY